MKIDENLKIDENQVFNASFFVTSWFTPSNVHKRTNQGHLGANIVYHRNMTKKSY